MIAEKERVQGLLKIIFKTRKGIEENIIYALRMEDNNWEYIRSNGQKMIKKTNLNPEKMAIALGKVYRQSRRVGEIHYKYIPN